MIQWSHWHFRYLTDWIDAPSRAISTRHPLFSYISYLYILSNDFVVACIFLTHLEHRFHINKKWVWFLFECFTHFDQLLQSLLKHCDRAVQLFSAELFRLRFFVAWSIDPFPLWNLCIVLGLVDLIVFLFWFQWWNHIDECSSSLLLLFRLHKSDLLRGYVCAGNFTVRLIGSSLSWLFLLDMDIADGQVSLFTATAPDRLLQGHSLLSLEEIEQRLAGRIVRVGKLGFAAIEHNELIYYYCITCYC